MNEREIAAIEARAEASLMRHPLDELTKLRERCAELERGNAQAAYAAHRACCGTEHDTANGKLHGYCVVCGVPWPCVVAQAGIDAALRGQEKT